MNGDVKPSTVVKFTLANVKFLKEDTRPNRSYASY